MTSVDVAQFTETYLLDDFVSLVKNLTEHILARFSKGSQEKCFVIGTFDKVVFEFSETHRTLLHGYPFISWRTFQYWHPALA